MFAKMDMSPAQGMAPGNMMMKEADAHPLTASESHEAKQLLDTESRPRGTFRAR
jgi:hypothetical protein